MYPISQKNIVINNMPYLREKTSTLLTVSSTIMMMTTTTSPLLLFNVIPVQASTTPLGFPTTPVSFRTPTPAGGALPCSSTGPSVNAALDFDAQGTASYNPLQGTITGGTFQITSRPDGQILYSGNIRQGQVREYNGQMTLALTSGIDRFPTTNSTSTCPSSGEVLEIDALCSIEEPTGYQQTSINVNLVNLEKKLHLGDFMGVVECFGQPQPQDTDGDGVPDSSDKCLHNSNPRCFKEAT
jgi:hypothetical protein